MPTTSMGTYLTALVTALKARPGLSGVQIWSAPIADTEFEWEAIAFIDIINDEEVATLGEGPNSRKEVYTIEGVAEVNVAGHGDVDATTARDRVIELVAEVETELRDSPDLGLGQPIVRFSEMANMKLRQRIREGYRRAILEFDIIVNRRK